MALILCTVVVRYRSHAYVPTHTNTHIHAYIHKRQSEKHSGGTKGTHIIFMCTLMMKPGQSNHISLCAMCVAGVCMAGQHSEQCVRV